MNHKQHIAHNFNKAAQSYDQVADLQRSVGLRLFDDIQKISFSPKLILDLGAGTGYFTKILRERYCASIIAVDIAEKMLMHHQQAAICADADHLPMPDQCVDLVFCNLMLQWSPDIVTTFREITRVLSPGGYFAATTFGPATLQELRTTWEQLDQHAHVNPFLSDRHLTEALSGLSLDTCHWERNHYIRRYPHVTRLMQELKGLGARNIHYQRSRKLTGRNTLIHLNRLYCQRTGHYEYLPASYEVYTLIVRKPHEH